MVLKIKRVTSILVLCLVLQDLEPLLVEAKGANGVHGLRSRINSGRYWSKISFSGVGGGGAIGGRWIHRVPPQYSEGPYVPSNIEKGDYEFFPRRKAIKPTYTHGFRGTKLVD